MIRAIQSFAMSTPRIKVNQRQSDRTSRIAAFSRTVFELSAGLHEA
jgi:hypothetical protein